MAWNKNSWNKNNTNQNDKREGDIGFRWQLNMQLNLARELSNVAVSYNEILYFERAVQTLETNLVHIWAKEVMMPDGSVVYETINAEYAATRKRCEMVKEKTFEELVPDHKKRYSMPETDISEIMLKEKTETILRRETMRLTGLMFLMNNKGLLLEEKYDEEDIN